MPAAVVVSCEHAACRIPQRYRPLFRHARRALASHRGWDPGAAELGRTVARRLDTVLLAARWSRLLVELNRSVGHPRLFSEFSRVLSPTERTELLAACYFPHRERVREAVRQQLAAGRRVIHLGVHSFTPVLQGEVRRADVGLLYDPRRAWERQLCEAWRQALRQGRPDLRIRRNYPYLGQADGLTTAFRREFSDAQYAGIEVEVNQAWVGRSGWRELCRDLAETAASIRD